MNYNLITEKWIPTNIGLVSLKDVFTNIDIKYLSCESAATIALTRFLTAIATRAVQVSDTEYDTDISESLDSIKSIMTSDISTLCVKYLDEVYEYFDIYGELPFLQTPEEYFPACDKNTFPIERLFSYMSVGSNKFYKDYHLHSINNADIALALLITQVYSPGYKKGKNSIAYGKTITIETVNATPTFAYGPITCIHHLYLIGNTLLETIKLNMVTNNVITDTYKSGYGIPFWELDQTVEYPESNYDTYYDRMIPASYKYIRIDGDTLVYAGSREAIVNHKECIYNYTITRPDKDSKIKNAIKKELHPTPNVGTFWRDFGAFINKLHRGSEAEFKVWDNEKLKYIDGPNIKLLSCGSYTKKKAMGLYSIIGTEQSTYEIQIDNNEINRTQRIISTRRAKQAYRMENTLKGVIFNYGTSMNFGDKVIKSLQDNALLLYWNKLSQYQLVLHELTNWNSIVTKCALQSFHNITTTAPKSIKLFAKGSKYIKRKVI